MKVRFLHGDVYDLSQCTLVLPALSRYGADGVVVDWLIRNCEDVRKVGLVLDPYIVPMFSHHQMGRPYEDFVSAAELFHSQPHSLLFLQLRSFFVASKGTRACARLAKLVALLGVRRVLVVSCASSLFYPDVEAARLGVVLSKGSEENVVRTLGSLAHGIGFCRVGGDAEHDHSPSDCPRERYPTLRGSGLTIGLMRRLPADTEALLFFIEGLMNPEHTGAYVSQLSNWFPLPRGLTCDAATFTLVA